MTFLTASDNNSGLPKIRRRRLVLLSALTVGVLLYLFAPWDAPAISRANMGSLMRKKVAVDEIYGLLHVVAGNREQQHVLSNVDLDPTVPLALSAYAPEDLSLDWNKEKDLINDHYPVVVFSKVCVHSYSTQLSP